MALSVVAVVSDGHAVSIFRVKVRWVRCECDRLHNHCPSKISVSTDRTECCLPWVDWCLKWYPVAVISYGINFHILSCGWMSAGGCFISWTRKILTINKKISRYITPSCSVSVCRLMIVLAELECVWVSFRSVLCTFCNCLCGSKILVKKKVKVTLLQALRLCTGCTAHRGSRGIALLFLDHGTRRGCGVSVRPRPLFTPGKDPAPIVLEARWAPGPVWTGAENLTPTGIRSTDRPARSQSL